MMIMTPLQSLLYFPAYKTQLLKADANYTPVQLTYGFWNWLRPLEKKYLDSRLPFVK